MRRSREGGECSCVGFVCTAGFRGRGVGELVVELPRCNCCRRGNRIFLGFGGGGIVFWESLLGRRVERECGRRF